MSAPAITATNVSKTFLIPHERRTTVKEYVLHPLRRTTYERNHALDDVSFTIERGEFFGVIGPNGSGKSTLLRVLAGIYPPGSGEVRVNGVLSPFIELGVGFNYELNARDNILINATLLGLTRRQINAKLDAILEFSELERFVDQKLKNYSSGMLLRLAYSVAIQVPFDILLLDEVLAVGDSSFQAKCFQTFERFRQEEKTVVFVSHDHASVARYCDRTLFLEQGVVQAVGPTDEVIETYRQRANERSFAVGGVPAKPEAYAPRMRRKRVTRATPAAQPIAAPQLLERPEPLKVDPRGEFHATHYVRHNQRRLEHLASLGLPIAGRSVLEVGAGIGDHTGFFLDRECSVISTDARPENVALLRERYPHIDTRLLDLDDPDPEFVSGGEIVHCYGVVNHLTRPAEALQFMADRCDSLLLLETVVDPADDVSMSLVEEPTAHPSLSLRGVGSRATRAWLHHELTRLFEHVYIPLTQPWHPEFPLDWTEPPDVEFPRAIFVASRARLDNPVLETELPDFHVRH